MIMITDSMVFLPLPLANGTGVSLIPRLNFYPLGHYAEVGDRAPDPLNRKAHLLQFIHLATVTGISLIHRLKTLSLICTPYTKYGTQTYNLSVKG